MIHTQPRQAFLKSEKAKQLREELKKMVKSPAYNTRLVGLSDDPDGTQFIEKYMNYMSHFPKMDHHQYILNLKLMTRIADDKK